MAYNSKAKIKILYLKQMLEKETDAEHGLSMTEILERLAEEGVSAERKSIYDDIKALREFGMDIQTYQRNPMEYAIEQRAFTTEELMLMADAIQSCQAITEHQANELVKNIQQLAPQREKVLLKGRIHVADRIKSKNDCVLGNVNLIHEALWDKKCKLEFGYRKFGADGEFFETREGGAHVVTPICVEYEAGFYYLVAWDPAHEGITQYRIDRMVRVTLLEGQKAERNAKIAEYKTEERKAKKFGRFEGNEKMVTLAAAPGKAEIIRDVFGKEATYLNPVGEEARARVKVCISEQFFGWVASMGNAVRIVAPKAVVQEYRNYLQALLDSTQGE